MVKRLSKHEQLLLNWSGLPFQSMKSGMYHLVPSSHNPYTQAMPTPTGARRVWTVETSPLLAAPEVDQLSSHEEDALGPQRQQRDWLQLTFKKRKRKILRMKSSRTGIRWMSLSFHAPDFPLPESRCSVK